MKAIVEHRTRSVLLSVAMVVAFTLVLWMRSKGTASDEAIPLVDDASPPIVAALGRIEPRDGLVRIAGPGRPAVVIADLRVAAGDEVAAGDVIAVLDDQSQLDAAVSRLRVERRDAQQQLARYRQLHKAGIVSAVELETVELRAAVAEAELRRMEAQLDQSTVRAPSAGTILEIYARTGERVGPDGIALLADTRQMIVLAEVYEADVPALTTGAAAIIESPALDRPVHGRVERIGRLVGKQRSFDLDPGIAVDRRVVEVRVAVDESQLVADWNNLQVDVSIAAHHPRQPG